MKNFLSTPERTTKNRIEGMTNILDNGLSTRFFIDILESHADLIDCVKFGWGSSLVTNQIQEKITACQKAGIEYYFGGTLFELAYREKKIDAFYNYCKHYQCPIVEISDGTIAIPAEDKYKYIKQFSKEFTVYSEVGYKNPEQSIRLPPNKWISFIQQDLEAGATKVITESRESGTSGICRQDGELRFGLVIEILDYIPAKHLIFEAPTKELQTFFIKQVGTNVNLGNIHPEDIVSLESLRLGLRSDTITL